jgi:hypothetical protein
MRCPIKGTHARDFKVCFKPCFASLSQKYIQNAMQPTFSKIFFKKFGQIFDVLDHSPFLLKARSMAERCCWKRGVKFSVVFVTVRFQIVLSIFGEKPESNLTFSVKARS